MTAPDLQSLDSAIRQLVAASNRNTSALLAALPQFYTLDDLAERYKLGREAVRGLLLEHGMFKPERGRTIRVMLADVLRLDKILKER